MLIAGVDEAGRGPIAGPVLAAAVILSKNRIKGLRDSKKINKKELLRLDGVIKKEAIAYGIGRASVLEIENINILRASLLAMSRAVNSLKVMPDIVLCDGNQTPDISIPTKTIIKGDTKIESIMAASIIAKVARDRIMTSLDRIYPQYNFRSNKGYPTKMHLLALKRYGSCKHHRETFNPVNKLDNLFRHEY